MRYELFYGFPCFISENFNLFFFCLSKLSVTGGYYYFNKLGNILYLSARPIIKTINRVGSNRVRRGSYAPDIRVKAPSSTGFFTVQGSQAPSHVSDPLPQGMGRDNPVLSGDGQEQLEPLEREDAQRRADVLGQGNLPGRGDLPHSEEKRRQHLPLPPRHYSGGKRARGK